MEEERSVLDRLDFISSKTVKLLANRQCWYDVFCIFDTMWQVRANDEHALAAFLFCFGIVIMLQCMFRLIYAWLCNCRCS